MKKDYSKFLKDNTKVREDILNQKLIFDLKEAFVKDDWHLKIYKADVDIDGFDLILDDNDQMLIKCQIKSKFESTTDHVSIHNSMLRPDCHSIEALGFEITPCHNDRRGIILIDGKINDNNIVVEYSYFDCFLLRAMALGIYSLGLQTQNSAKKLISNINTYGLYQRDKKTNIRKVEKLKVNYSLFFPLKSASDLIPFLDNTIAGKILDISKAKLAPQTDVEKTLVKLQWEELNDDLCKMAGNNKFKRNPFPDNF
jgi:hypothetical protein